MRALLYPQQAVADWCSNLFDGALADLPELDDGFELPAMREQLAWIEAEARARVAGFRTPSGRSERHGRQS